MPVKVNPNFLLTFSKVSLVKEVIKESLIECLNLEPLNPKELGSEWENIIFDTPATTSDLDQNSSQDIQLLDKVIAEYQPKGIVNQIQDERIVIKKDLLQKALIEKQSILAKAKDLLQKIDTTKQQPSKKIQLPKIEAQDYYQLASLHAVLQLDRNIAIFTQKIFTLKENSKTKFLFLSLSPQHQEKFLQKLEKAGIVFEKVKWNKDIIDWENTSGLLGFQGIMQGLGTINNKEADPTPVVAIFFMIFFAFSFADAVYGLIVALITGYFYFFGKLKSSLKGMFGLFFFSGVATFLFGVLNKSWLGDLFTNPSSPTYSGGINSLLENFQLLDILNPQNPAPINQFLLGVNLSPIIFMMGLSVLIGFAHVITAYIYTIINSAKQNHKTKTAEGINWILFVFSLLAVVFTSQTNPSLLALVSLPLVISTLGLFVFNTSKNIFGKIVAGLGKVYGLISLLSDTISYTRLLAAGLAGTIIANVVNILAGLSFESGGLGFVFGIVILVVGHIFNLVISIFSAYINSLRLHYVEFAPKFYQGLGKKFSPVEIDYKYLKISD